MANTPPGKLQTRNHGLFSQNVFERKKNIAGRCVSNWEWFENKFLQKKNISWFEPGAFLGQTNWLKFTNGRIIHSIFFKSIN